MTEPEWVEIDGYGRIPFFTVSCCRDWLVAPMFGWGACGLCGQRPKR